MSTPRMIKINEHEQYSLGDSLGRGAFGSVYRGLNTHSGETVAVKQIKLKNIAETEATEIMGEIDLLKNLNHPNIVKYHCFYKSVDSLFIVLEYCENGSLASICKSFGVFPEHLVAIYTDQVLLGLIYLHDQGVIHRDIKGANILTTKDGTVKLADFGVATNVLSDMTVVGSPYWMAPEIIELAGATSASDIWSLGCVIIELLQGRPPYSDMDQMSALFHIVDDEHPPFPDGASAGARDFLVRCFQKNPNLRTSAKKLRKHTWITNHVKNGSHRSRSSHTSSPLDFDDAVNSVQEYNEKVNGPDLVSKTSRRTRSPEKQMKYSNNALRRKPVPIPKHYEDIDEDWSKDLEFKSSGGAIRMPLKLKPTHAVPHSASKSIESVWDDDFAVGLDKSKVRALKSTLSSSQTRSAPTLQNQARPLLQQSKSAAPLSRRRSPERPALADATIRPSSSQLARTATDTPPGTPKTRRVSTSKEFLRASSSLSGNLTPQRSQISQATTSKVAQDNANKTILALQQYAEEHEDYSDIIGDVEQSNPLLASKFNSSEFSNKSWLQDDDVGEDPFADIEEFEKENLTANVLREQKARAIQQMEQLLKKFQLGNKHELELLECIREIQDSLIDHPDLKPTIISGHGLLPLLEILESSTEDDLILVILELLNRLALNDEEVQENISFVGGISSVTKFAYKKYNQDIRTQAAIFVRQMLASSDLNAQIFVSCRGLGILTELLEEDYHEARTLVMTGIEGIVRVFSLQGKYTPRNDLCRIMAQTGVLEPLTHTLHVLIAGERDQEDDRAISSILKIMLTFAQADEYVKQLVATRTVLKRIMMDLNLMSGDQLVSALKFVKSLSSVTSTLEVLHNSNAIECLVRLLADTSIVSYQEIANHVLTTLFNLCRIDKARQYEAATVGLIPILKRIVSHDRPLKDMALPMLCNMAHNKDCRRLLWSQRGLDFYVKLLADPFWQVNAFEAIVVWFFEEPARVEKSLLESNASEALISAFASARGVPFESLLDQLQKLLKASRRLSRVFNVPSFLTKLMERLGHPKPTVRANLLKVLQSVLDVCAARGESIGQYDIVRVLTDLSEKDGAIIVKALAGSMLRSIEDRGTGESFFDAKEQQSWDRHRMGKLNGSVVHQSGRSR